MTSAELGAPSATPVEVDESDLLNTPDAGPAALRGSVLRTASYVGGILLSLVSAPLLIRHLGQAEFGRFSVVISLIAIVSGFTEGGLNSIVLREYATLSGERRTEMMRSAIGIRTVLTVVGVILAIGFAVLAGYSSTLVLGTALAGAALVLQLFQSLLSVALQSQLRFGWVSAAELLRQFVNTALIVALVLAGAGLVPLFAVAIPAAAASLALTTPLVLRLTPLRPSFHLGHWWSLLRESLPWAAISAVNIVYFRLAIILMSLVATAVQTGYFATSFRVVEVLVGVPGLVISAAFPILVRAARDDSERFDYASGRIFELALLAGTWLVLCLEVGAGFAIHVLAGNHADPAVAVLRIQGLAVIATFASVACGYPLLTMRRYRLVLYTNLGALVLVGMLTLALVPSLGARGGAIAAVIAETALASTEAVILTRSGHRVRLPLSAIFVAALAGGIAVAVGLSLPIPAIAGAVVASLVYFAVLGVLGRFPAEVREVLGHRIAALRVR